MSKIVQTSEEAKHDQVYKDALAELLYQFADDDLIISFRGSEWLGLAPHIEEDVASSSIVQNTMGHAAMFFQLLEDLGEGDRDFLAHGRPAKARRSSTYLEKMNGDGQYMKEPNYDWALAVVRNFFYETLKRVKLVAATNSSYIPLQHIARKIVMEQTYHYSHWKLWLEQLQDASDEAKNRINQRIEEAWQQFGDALLLGEKSEAIVAHHILIDETTLKARWLKAINQVLIKSRNTYPKHLLGNGRNGEYNADLVQAMDIFTEVYVSDPQAAW